MPSGGRASREKGMRRERQIVEMHIDLGVHSERVPLSGAARYQQNGGDVDTYPFGVHSEDGPIIFEVKARESGEGWTTLERWLGDSDALALIRDRASPLIVMPWATYERILLVLKRARGGAK